MIDGALSGMYSFKGETDSLDKVVGPNRGDVYIVPQEDGSKNNLLGMVQSGLRLALMLI